MRVQLFKRCIPEDRTTTETEIIIDNKGLEDSLDTQIEVQSIEDPELHLCSPSRESYRCLRCRQFVHFAKEYPEKDSPLGKLYYREENIPEHKECYHLYEGGPEEDEEEEVKAAVCHNGETYSPILVNIKDDDYFKHLNQ